MIGININDKTQPFTRQIIAGCKTVETRGSPSLRPYVGKRVGIVRTGCGRACVVAYADIVSELAYTSARAFKRDFRRHRVSQDSKFSKTSGYGYVLANVCPVEPIPVTTLGIVARKIPGEVHQG